MDFGKIIDVSQFPRAGFPENSAFLNESQMMSGRSIWWIRFNVILQHCTTTPRIHTHFLDANEVNLHRVDFFREGEGAGLRDQ